MVCCLVLAGCSQQNNSTQASSSTSTEITEAQTQTTSSSAQSSSTGEETIESSSSSSETGTSSKATFNGSYYSVQGKYGEVVIANKKHPLAKDYAPGENPEALAAFQQLVADMQAKGFDVSNNYSGFRSYETQATLYQSYVNQEGQAVADTYSARPGYSEHQTGLAFDILDSAGNLLEIKIENYEAIILDDRIINILNENEFDELQNLKNISREYSLRKVKAKTNYLEYLKNLNTLASRSLTKPTI